MFFHEFKGAYIPVRFRKLIVHRGLSPDLFVGFFKIFCAQVIGVGIANNLLK